MKNWRPLAPQAATQVCQGNDVEGRAVLVKSVLHIRLHLELQQVEGVLHHLLHLGLRPLLGLGLAPLGCRGLFLEALLGQ